MAGNTHDFDSHGTDALLQLARLLRADEVDAAIEAGLMAFVPPVDMHADPVVADALRLVAGAQRRLREAWAARERHHARNARLQRRAAARSARRTAPAATDAAKPALPPAAAAALARAKARAAGKP